MISPNSGPCAWLLPNARRECGSGSDRRHIMDEEAFFSIRLERPRNFLADRQRLFDAVAERQFDTESKTGRDRSWERTRSRYAAPSMAGPRRAQCHTKSRRKRGDSSANCRTRR